MVTAYVWWKHANVPACGVLLISKSGVALSKPSTASLLDISMAVYMVKAEVLVKGASPKAFRNVWYWKDLTVVPYCNLTSRQILVPSWPAHWALSTSRSQCHSGEMFSPKTHRSSEGRQVEIKKSQSAINIVFLCPDQWQLLQRYSGRSVVQSSPAWLMRLLFYIVIIYSSRSRGTVKDGDVSLEKTKQARLTVIWVLKTEVIGVKRKIRCLYKRNLLWTLSSGCWWLVIRWGSTGTH